MKLYQRDRIQQHISNHVAIFESVKNFTGLLCQYHITSPDIRDEILDKLSLPIDFTAKWLDSLTGSAYFESLEDALGNIWNDLSLFEKVHFCLKCLSSNHKFYEEDLGGIVATIRQINDLKLYLEDVEKRVRDFYAVNNMETQKLHFKVRFDDPFSAVDRIYDCYVDDQLKWTIDDLDYYSPYTSIFQSSGVGKSRLVLQLAPQKNVYIVYTNFAYSGARGYPERSTIADLLTEIVEGGNSDVDYHYFVRYSAYIVACIECARVAFDLKFPPVEFSELFVEDGGKGIYPWIKERINQHIVESRFKLPLQSIWDSLKKNKAKAKAKQEDPDQAVAKYQISEIVKALCDDSTWDMNVYFQNHYQPGRRRPMKSGIMMLEELTDIFERKSRNKVSLGKLEILIACDEMSNSFDPNKKNAEELKKKAVLLPFRRALSFLPKANTIPIFSFLLGTSSKLSYLSPPTVIDSSERASLQGFKLFPPFLLVDLFHIHVIHERVKGKTLEQIFDDSMFYSTGRALWFPFLTSPDYSWTRMINFAARKLFGGTPHYPTVEHIDMHTATAVFRSRCCFRLKDFAFCNNLVASNMATCYRISEKRDELSIAYVPEPALATGATMLMMNPNLKGRLFQEFASAVTNTLVDVGESGELAAQILLLMAADKCRPRSENGRIKNQKWIPLKEFLKTFLSDEDFEKFCENYPNATELLDCGYISLLQFMDIMVLPTRVALAHYFASGIGLLLRENQEIADILLTIFVARRGISLLEQVLTPYRITYLIIQVKNQAELSSKSTLQAMTPKSMKLEPSEFDSIAILMDFYQGFELKEFRKAYCGKPSPNPVTRSQYQPRQPETFGVHIRGFGINTYPFMHDGRTEVNVEEPIRAIIRNTRLNNDHQAMTTIKVLKQLAMNETFLDGKLNVNS
jgi:hypothetical protein